MKSPAIRTFSYHYRKKYGCSVGKVALDLNHQCPNRKKGGCIFCRPVSYTPAYLSAEDDIATQLASGKQQFFTGRFLKFFVYFQHESCTAAKPGILLSALRSLLSDKDCVGAILSTRPDCVEEQLLDSLEEIVLSTGKEILFELGLQTVHDRSLISLNRNHSYADFTDCVSRILQRSCFEIGAHLIFGIPGESHDEMMTSVKTVCSLGLGALKLHHLQVIKNTRLHTLYLQGKVKLFSQKEYEEFLLEVIPHIPKTVTLHRLWATSHPEYLIAPRWNCLASSLSNSLRLKMRNKGLWQGKAVTL